MKYFHSNLKLVLEEIVVTSEIFKFENIIIEVKLLHYYEYYLCCIKALHTIGIMNKYRM